MSLQRQPFLYLIVVVLLISLGLGAALAAPGAPAAIEATEPVVAFSYQDTLGTVEAAYPADVAHILTPGGLFVDGADNVYVTAERGKRVLAYNNAGANLFWLGKPGVGYTDDYVFSSPRDVAVDGSGDLWVAEANRVVQYDGGTQAFVQSLPAEDSWQSGNDNTHFDQVIGVAFDSSGRMFVADSGNQRVQVYTFAGDAPVYAATIGDTGVPGSDDDHFNYPLRLAVDSSDRLYVVDSGNDRVQRCGESMGSWSCTTFASALANPGGIAIDSVGDVYITDRENYQILHYDSSGNELAAFAADLGAWMVDVAVDSAGQVYASDWTNHVVREYDNGGNELAPFAGTEGEPYTANSNYYYEPWGMTTDADGNLYVAERLGMRLHKLKPDGTELWSVGEAGVWGSDNQHFGDYWAGIEGSPAVAADGKVYVTDTGNHRVQVFDANGNYLTTHGSYGTGNNQFDIPAGIAINPLNGDFVVNDRGNQRVQVFDSNWQYKLTLGATDQAGSDNTHFDGPWDVATDSQGRIYVADTDNSRIQRCTVSGTSYSCTTFAGGSSTFSGSFDYLRPLTVDVDEMGRVYIADEWNYRVQVFDENGAYLTTIGGTWGARPGEFRNTAGVAVAPDGTVYISSAVNQTIQKFARGIDGWEQVNISGFDKNTNQGVWSVYPYDGALYASTFNLSSGAEVYRLSGDSWEQVATGGFADSTNVGVDDFIAFDGMLYAGTWNDDSHGGQIWRSATGDSGSWLRVVDDGFGDAVNAEIMTLQTFDGYLYAGTWTGDGHGAEIWRSASGDPGSWSEVANDATFGESGNDVIFSMQPFGGDLYAATGNSSGGELWRTSDGTSWEQVDTNGFGSGDNIRIVTLAVHNGVLYAGTWNEVSGGQLWQSSDGESWTQVEGGGFDGSDNRAISSLQPLDEYLYAVVANSETGPEVWRSDNPGGGNWERVGNYGFGAGASQAVDWEPTATVYEGTLYVGTFSPDGRAGGRLFRHVEQQFVYLPMVVR